MSLMGKWTKLKEAASDAKTKISESEYLAAGKEKLQELKASAEVKISESELLSSGKDKLTQLASSAKKKVDEFDFESLKKRETYINKFTEYKDLGTEKVSSLYRSTFEVDKTTSEMVNDLRSKLPARPSDIDEIFQRCKDEAIQRAVSAFALAPIMGALDLKLEARYSNLSQSYSEFSNQNNLHDDKNFADLKNHRYEASEAGALLENVYSKADPLYSSSTDIEHIVSKKQYFEDFIFRIVKNDDEIIQAMNAEENLGFAASSLNRSKGSRDLMEYLSAEGKPDEFDPDLIRINVQGQEYTVDKKDVEARYEKAQQAYQQQKTDALKELGLTVASAGIQMAAQQVVGLILVETIDILVDEIKDVAVNGKLFDENGLIANIDARRKRISDRLSQRFEERQIWARARAAGVEGGVAGVLSAIPQILISIIVKMPAFVLSMIRECTLSVVRCVRVLVSDDESKFESIKVIMFGTAAAVLAVYVSNVISKAIRPVPMLNIFNRQVTEVLSGVVVTAVPLSAIYVFERNKSKFAFSILGGGKSASA